MIKPKVAVFLALLGSVPAWAQTLQVAPDKPSGVYAAGEKIIWNVTISGEVKRLRYVLKHGGGKVLTQGELPVTDGKAQLETTQTEPLAYLAEFHVTGTEGKEIKALGGAVVEPTAIRPALPRPTDFDAFWEGKLKELAKVPMNPQVEATESGREGVEYAKVLLDNIGGSKIHAQLARPKTGTKFPALLLLQYAGVYGLPKTNVTNRAAEGWLTLNVMAHDLPFDETPEFYKKQSDGPLKDYVGIGNKSRETSYFLRMVLGCYRASEYLMSRPDWDGRILVASGTSQGGFQSIAVAALQPKLTAVLVNVPAGADHGALSVGRGVPWPYWANHAKNGTDTAIMETSRYFDLVNFAPRIRVPCLVALGLIDQTSTPSGVLAMTNQLQGPVERVLMPLSEHKASGGSQAAYSQRSGVWLRAMKEGKEPPVARP